MTRKVNVYEAKTQLSKLLEEVEVGGEVVIAATASLSRASCRCSGRYHIGFRVR